MSQSESDNNWYEDMHRCGWQMPIVSRWKRWPIIRHVRAVFHRVQLMRHQRIVRAMFMCESGYDEWVLYGMWKGREGRKRDPTDRRGRGYAERRRI